MFQNIRGHTITADGLFPGMVVIDAGANRGEFTRELKARFPGKYYLIEANPYLVAELRNLPEVTVLPNALTARPGPVPFHISKNPVGSSLLTLPTESVWGSTLDHTEIVTGITLEQVLDWINEPRIHLLKMDIEGAEIEVLHNIPQSRLEIIDQVTVEFHSAPEFGFDLARPVEQVIRRLRQAGFVAMDFSRGTRIDVLFLNRRKFQIPPWRRLVWRLRNARPPWLNSLWQRVPHQLRWRFYGEDRLPPE